MVDAKAKANGYTIGPVKHGTTHKFNVFDLKLANVENYFGKGHYFTNSDEDVENNYAGIGPDLTSRLDQYAENLFDSYTNDPDAEDQLITDHSTEIKEMVERLNRERDLTGVSGKVSFEDVARDFIYSYCEEVARKTLAPDAPRTINAFVRLKKPCIIGGPDSTKFTYKAKFDRDGDVVSKSGTLNKFITKLREECKNYYADDEVISVFISDTINEAMDNGGEVDLEYIDSEFRKLNYTYDSDGKNAVGELLRATLESLGYDGIIDKTVYKKFGPKAFSSGMVGMTPDTKHVIVFDKPGDIKAADAVTYDDKGEVIPLSKRFNSRSPDYRKSSNGFETKFNSNHDQHTGRFTSGHGSSSNSSLGSSFVGCDDTSIQGSWLDDHYNQYQSDKQFRHAVDGITAFCQGRYCQFRDAASYMLTGKWRYVGTDGYNRFMTSTEDLDSSIDTTYVEPLFTGQYEDHALPTLRDSTKAIMEAIATAPSLDKPIYRAISVASDNPDSYNRLAKLVHSKVGSTIKLPAPSSFTTDLSIATGWITGDVPGSVGSNANTSVILQVMPGAKGIPVANLSTYDQKEVLSQGDFKILNKTTKTVEVDPYRSAEIMYITVEQTKVYDSSQFKKAVDDYELGDSVLTIPFLQIETISIGGEKKYNPDQPRIPKGQEGGGRWGSGVSHLVKDRTFKVGDMIYYLNDLTTYKVSLVNKTEDGHYTVWGETPSGLASKFDMRDSALYYANTHPQAIVKDGEKRDYLNPDTGELESVVARYIHEDKRMRFYSISKNGKESPIDSVSVMGYNTIPEIGTIKRSIERLQKDPTGKSLEVGDILLSSAGDRYHSTMLVDQADLDTIKRNGADGLAQIAHGRETHLFRSLEEYQELRKLSKKLYPEDSKVLSASDSTKQLYKRQVVDGLTARLMSNFNNDAETQKLITTMGSTGNTDAVENRVQATVDAWAQASNTGLSIATQNASIAVFGLESSDNQKTEFYTSYSPSDSLVSISSRALVKTMYSWTQSYLKTIAETDKIKLYRGLRLRDDAEVKVGDVIDLNDNALASWAWHPEPACMFARQSLSMFDRHNRRVLVEAEVDAKDILCTPATGLGCFSEAEMVVMSRGPRKVKVLEIKQAEPLPPIDPNDPKI